jgi:hypothetical protein
MSILPERKPEVPIPAPALLDERAALTSYLESLFAPAPMYYPVPVSPPSREGVVPREPRECAQRPPAEQVVEIISPPPTIVAAPPVAGRYRRARRHDRDDDSPGAGRDPGMGQATVRLPAVTRERSESGAAAGEAQSHPAVD